MSKHIPFPEIGQYRNAIRAVTERAQFKGHDAEGKAIYDKLMPMPTLAFVGTVKLHGTNAAVCLDRSTGEIWFQSRELVITEENDNAGFVAANKTKLDTEFFRFMTGASIAIFGEWCGQGINKGTGISGLPKMFVVFAVRVDGRWLSAAEIFLPEDIPGVYWIEAFQRFFCTIDFRDPSLSQNALVDITNRVEASCPVAEKLGHPGVGEGVVWRCTTPGWDSSRFWFKVKGEKHSVTKVKILAEVDVEILKSQQSFVGITVTEARCQQSVAKLREAGKPTDRTSLGDFIRWIFHDIVKEESDRAAASQLDITKMGNLISNAAKTWFFKNEAAL